MKKTLTWTLAFLLALVPAAAMAGSHDGKDSPNDEEREVTASVSATQATIDMTREDNETKDSVVLRFATTDTVLELDYEFTTEGYSFENTASHALRQIVEYRDEDGDGAFSEGDTVVSSWRLSEGQRAWGDTEPNGTAVWQPLQEADVERDGVQGKQVTAIGRLVVEEPVLPLPPPIVENVTDGTVRLDIFAFGSTTEHENGTLKATEFQLVLSLADYPYAAQDTALAVIIDTEAETGLDRMDGVISDARFDDGWSTVRPTGNVSAELRLAWRGEATVGDQIESVSTTVLATEHGGDADDVGNVTVSVTYALSYARGDSIHHDPVAGAWLSDPGDRGLPDDLQLPSPSVAAVALAVLAALAVMARRRKA